MRARVITCSTRAAAGHYEDLTGPVLEDFCREQGYEARRDVVADGDAVGEAIGAALAAGCDLVLTTGGTGVSPSDATPEQTAPYLVAELPGIAEALRRSGAETTPHAALSRGLAGVADAPGSAAGRAVVVNLPGSRGGVTDGIAVLAPLLSHLASQLAGGDHVHGGLQHGADEHGGHEHGADEHGGPPQQRAEQQQFEQQHRHQAGLTHPHDPDLGGAGARVVRARVTEEPISAAAAADLAADPRCGAVVSFEGTVRNHDEGRDVTWLRYTAHPGAQGVIEDIARQIATAHHAVRIVLEHRIGDLAIGDAALVAVAASAHRHAAMRAVDEAVEIVKLRLPIWKEQGFPDGSSSWVGALG